MLIAFMIAISHSACGDLRETFYQDFRSSQTSPPAIMEIAKGQGEHQVIRREAQGLRIILTDKRSASPMVGVSPRFHVKGDFEITISYEILKLEKPTAGYGVGVGLWVMAEADSVDAAFLSRSSRISPGNVYVAGKGWWSSRENKYHTNQKVFASESKFGKLRLRRTGSLIQQLVAEGADEKFREIAHQDYTDKDLSQIHVGVNTGGATGSLDVRIIDLKVRAEELPLAVSKSRTRRSWATWFVVGLVGVGILIFGAVSLWRRSLQISDGEGI